MNTKLTPWLLLLSFVCALIAAPTSAAEGETLQNPALERFYSELRNLFRKHYPKATSHLLQDQIHFEHDTHVFLVHEPPNTIAKANRRPSGQSAGLGQFVPARCSRRASPAAVAELYRYTFTLRFDESKTDMRNAPLWAEQGAQ